MIQQPGQRGLGFRKKRNERRACLQLEALEDRLVPADLFVSTLGADLVDPAAGRGSRALPFRSIQFAVNQAASGDQIHVAQGTYGYNPAANQLSPVLNINPAVVMLYDKSLTLLGGFDNTFSALDPARFKTVLDGGSVYRGVYVLANQVDVSFSMSGFTIQAGLGQAERNLAVGAGDDRIFGFGGGMWINAAARRTSGAPGSYTLRDMVFNGNRALGLDTTTLAPEPGQTPGVGGAGAGGALALRFVPNVTLDRVTFANNEARGGAGAVRGGDAVGGAMHTDHAAMNGTNLVFVNNRSLAGNSTGAGTTTEAAGRRTADGLAGAAAIQESSVANWRFVTAFGNFAFGGNAGGFGGGGQGGAFIVEDSDVALTDATLRNNTARGGAGQNGGVATGGALAMDSGNITFDRVQVLNNLAEGGNGSVLAGPPGGGGLYLPTPDARSVKHRIVINNSLIADNEVRFGSNGDTSAGGGGGGLWFQGVDATITNTTIANNRIGPNLVFGQAIILINDGLVNGLAPFPTTVTIVNSIVANHTNGNNPVASAVHVRPQNGRNQLTYSRVLMVNNSKEDNSDGQPEPPGTFNGRDTILRAADARFVSPGGPRYDYDLLPDSPAVNASVGGAQAIDIEQLPRSGTPDLGAYEAATVPRARDTVGTFDPNSGLWTLRNSNSTGFANVAMFAYGAASWIPLAGDWNGDGTTTIGVYDPATATFYLKNSNGAGAPDFTPFAFGAPGWLPVVGDWDGNGTFTVGVFDPATAMFYLRNSNSSGGADAGIFAYGSPGSLSRPVAGDWNGDSITTIGVIELPNPADPNAPRVLTWKLRNSNSGGGADAGVFAFGADLFRPVTGDWNSDRQTTIGALDVTGRWYLRNSTTPGGADAGNFLYGTWGAIPVAGNWDNVAALRVAGGAAAGANLSPLTDAELQAFATAVLGDSPRVAVADLAGDLLALANPAEGRILLDADAAGHGWFVDPTPDASEEFDAALRALAGGPAVGRIDLRTVLRHEAGHLLGQPDADGGDTLMTATLPPGTRR
ncbi:MAG: hypothetical protein IT429_07055 [Gemmataceae bacterium]|nr:hypothetical protein [Gemmataceae bacterium]